MKTQLNNDVLTFNKSSLVELNDHQMKDVDSGITPFFVITAFGVGFGVGLEIGEVIKNN